MKFRSLNKLQFLQPAISIILLMHLHILISQQSAIPLYAEPASNSSGEGQITQQIDFNLNTGWLQTKQYSQDLVVNIGVFYQSVFIKFSCPYISIRFNDFPITNPPEYQQRLIYTLINSSDL